MSVPTVTADGLWDIAYAPPWGKRRHLSEPWAGRFLCFEPHYRYNDYDYTKLSPEKQAEFPMCEKCQDALDAMREGSWRMG